MNLSHCSGSIPPRKRTTHLPLCLGGEQSGEGIARGQGIGHRVGVGLLLPNICPRSPHTHLPQAHCTLCMAEGLQAAQEAASSPGKRHLANSKLSDLERVKVLPWQKKLPRNPENIGRDVGYKLLA